MWDLCQQISPSTTMRPSTTVDPLYLQDDLAAVFDAAKSSHGLMNATWHRYVGYSLGFYAVEFADGDKLYRALFDENSELDFVHDVNEPGWCWSRIEPVWHMAD